MNLAIENNEKRWKQYQKWDEGMPFQKGEGLSKFSDVKKFNKREKGDHFKQHPKVIWGGWGTNSRGRRRVSLGRKKKSLL